MNVTERVLSIFDEINTIPRRSHHLEKIHAWLMQWARSHGYQALTDAARNIVITVPATSGFESGPTLVLQGHMDMVCEKRTDTKHDFSTDPIVSWRDGDWLRARDTSLGADNGIALAMFFDLVTAPDAEHPPLEILITSDEESGLVGAQRLERGMLTGTILLNLDSEDEGVFTIGCSGGEDTNLSLPISREEPPQRSAVRKVRISGLGGGHSGIDINCGKACANVLITRALRTLISAIPELRIGKVEGGSAHNAIPRVASALITVPAGRLDDLTAITEELESNLRAEFAGIEEGLRFDVEEAEAPAEGVMSAESSRKIIDALGLVPHGVWAMSTVFDNAVDTSSNFAILKTDKQNVRILTNRRSATMSRGADLSSILFGLARLCGGTHESGFHYPPWEPRGDSDVLERSRRIWKEQFGADPHVEVTHAGLECGAIGATYPDMDMISFGPTIRQPHSPDERMHIPSVGRVQTFLRELVRSYT